MFRPNKFKCSGCHHEECLSVAHTVSWALVAVKEGLSLPHYSGAFQVTHGTHAPWLPQTFWPQQKIKKIKVSIGLSVLRCNFVSLCFSVHGKDTGLVDSKAVWNISFVLNNSVLFVYIMKNIFHHTLQYFGEFSCDYALRRTFSFHHYQAS